MTLFCRACPICWLQSCTSCKMKSTHSGVLSDSWSECQEISTSKPVASNTRYGTELWDICSSNTSKIIFKSFWYCLQLTLLIELLKTLDPEFYSYLDAKDSGNLFFCFRWLLIWFKREFAFTEVMGLWEVLWTDLPCQNFHLVGENF